MSCLQCADYNDSTFNQQPYYGRMPSVNPSRDFIEHYNSYDVAMMRNNARMALNYGGKSKYLIIMKALVKKKPTSQNLLQSSLIYYSHSPSVGTSKIG